jgi:hypothetical protein
MSRRGGKKCEGVGFGLYKRQQSPKRDGGEGRNEKEGWMRRLRVTAKRRGETKDLQGSRQIHCRESGSSQEVEG